MFKDSGAEITLASPKGGQPPLDPKSNEPSFQTDQTRRFEADPVANKQLAQTVRLDSVRQEDFDTVFYPGGHGPLWDIAEDRDSIKLIEAFLAADKPVALVCHAPGALRHVKTPDGRPLVEGKRVTGFTNSERQELASPMLCHFSSRTNSRPMVASSKGRGLGCFHRDRWPAHHRPEPSVVFSGRHDAARKGREVRSRPDWTIGLGSVDSYLSHRIVAVRAIMARTVEPSPLRRLLQSTLFATLHVEVQPAFVELAPAQSGDGLL